MKPNYNPIKSLILSIIVFVVVSAFFRFIMFIPGVRLIASLLFLLAPVIVFLLIRRKFTNFKDQLGKNYRDTYGQENDRYQQDNMRGYKAGNNETNNSNQNGQNNNGEIIAEVLEVKDLDKDE